MKRVVFLIGVLLISISVLAQTSELNFPLGGNAFSSKKGSKTITNKGIENWSDVNEQFTLYLRTTVKGKLTISVGNLQVQERASIGFLINGDEQILELSKGLSAKNKILSWNIMDTGYVAIKLRGIVKKGDYFPNLEQLILGGNVLEGNTAFVRNNEGNFYYWGRRGPSVHLTYPLPDNFEATYFYNEITVPIGDDVIGSYYMANGFAEGYFGIQVNSDTERRVLFSVWSPFNTDDPKAIPDDQKIKLIKKGTDVYTGEFGNEGSGGQSYLRYNWKAGSTYKFLLKGVPGNDSTTTYTAWFYPPELGEWKLIASFERPKTKTHLKRFHSFLENFIPETGLIVRKVNFNNQWVADAAGNWKELTNARFTVDNTGRVKFRMDYAGGKIGEGFYLQNCGFFDNYTPAGSIFDRPILNNKPLVDLRSIDKVQ